MSPPKSIRVGKTVLPKFPLRAGHTILPSSMSHDFMSFITSHYRGGVSEQIKKLEEWGSEYGPYREHIPTVVESPRPVSPTRVGAVATTLSFKNLNIAGGRVGSPKATAEDAFLLASQDRFKGAVDRVKKYSLALSDAEKRDLIDLAHETVARLVDRLLKPAEADEFIRSLHVEWTSKGITLSLEGWEAASREVGWAPTPGGLDAGLGKYDGSLHDMKPILLGGRGTRVIPLKLKGTEAELASKIEATTLPLADTISSDYVSKFSMGTRPGDTNYMVDKRTKFQDEFVGRVRAEKNNARTRREGSISGMPVEGSFRRVKGVAYGVERDFGSKPGDGLLSPEGKTRVFYSRSLLGGAVRGIDRSTRGESKLSAVKSARKPGNVTRGPDGTFIVFRTVVSPGRAEEGASLPGYDVDWRSYKKRRRHHRTTNAMAKMSNSQAKWWTAGRPPFKILEMAAEIVRRQVEFKLSNQATEAFTEFSSLAGDLSASLSSKYDDDEGVSVGGILQDLQSFLSQAWSATTRRKK
jgi:hypothetical protein